MRWWASHGRDGVLAGMLDALFVSRLRWESPPKFQTEGLVETIEIFRIVGRHDKLVNLGFWL